jgi:transcriptional regulator with XRE-family HTH domain
MSIGLRIGTIVRDGRDQMGLSMSGLADRVGVSRQMIAAVECGQANPTLDVLVRLLDGLGLKVDITVQGLVVIGGPPSRDVAHAICSGYVQRRLEAAGWKTAREVRIEEGRYVGWIDLLAFHEPTGVLLVIEIKTRIDDLGSIERSLDWYLRAAVRAARRYEWRPRHVRGWLVALATDEVETRIRENRSAFEVAFPARASEMTAVITDPSSLRHVRGLALIDPGSRRRAWLIRTKADGRRSDAPYRGYADFITRRRRPSRPRPSRPRRHSQQRP